MRISKGHRVDVDAWDQPSERTEGGPGEHAANGNEDDHAIHGTAIDGQSMKGATITIRLRREGLNL